MYKKIIIKLERSNYRTICMGEPSASMALSLIFLTEITHTHTHLPLLRSDVEILI